MVGQLISFTTHSLTLSLALSLLRDGVGSRAGGVDISELTWEQKEQCLRLLFAKMNRRKTALSANSLQGTKTQTPALPAPPSHPEHAESANSPSIFITEHARGVDRGVASNHAPTTLEQVT